LRYIGTHHVRAVPAEDLGDGRANTPRGAGDHGDLARQRLVPVGRRRGVVGVDGNDLTGDVSRFAGQQEAQRRLQCRGGGLGGDVDQLGGGSALGLLAYGAGEALQCALGDGLLG